MTNTFRLRIALAAIVTGVPACAVARQAAAPMDTTSCGAVAAAIDSLVIGSQRARVGLVAETTPRGEPRAVPGFVEAVAGMPELDSSTLESFRENNARAQPACATLPLVGGMTRITREELDALQQRDAEAYWRAFHARFPGVAGVTSTSGIGIGRGGRQALLVLDHSCGGLCGTGHVVLLERDDDGKWKVKRAVMTWIS